MLAFRSYLVCQTAITGDKLLREFRHRSYMMPEHISEKELQRMQEFAKTPVYKRNPEQLLPGTENQD